MANKYWDKESVDYGDCDLCSRKDVKIMPESSYDPHDGNLEVEYYYCWNCKPTKETIKQQQEAQHDMYEDFYNSKEYKDQQKEWELNNETT